jgi:single-strand DNA-binding protein
MPSLNRVVLIGNLTRDPELRYIPSGQAVATFTLAMNRVYTINEEKKEDTTFVRIVVWARRAEICAQYLKKGSPACVEGRLQSRNWEAPDGQKRSTIEVVANNVQFLGRGQGKGSTESDSVMGQDIQTEEKSSVGESRPASSPEPSMKSQEDEVPF